jgi:hypothetical protein
VGEALAQNRPLIKLARKLGFDVIPMVEEGTVQLQLRLVVGASPGAEKSVPAAALS